MRLGCSATARLLRVERGAFKAADRDLAQAARAARRSGQTLMLAGIEQNIGWLHARTGDIPAALSAYQRAGAGVPAARRDAEHPAARPIRPGAQRTIAGRGAAVGRAGSRDGGGRRIADLGGRGGAVPGRDPTATPVTRRQPPAWPRWPSFSSPRSGGRRGPRLPITRCCERGCSPVRWIRPPPAGRHCAAPGCWRLPAGPNEPWRQGWWPSNSRWSPAGSARRTRNCDRAAAALRSAPVSVRTQAWHARAMINLARGDRRRRGGGHPVGRPDAGAVSSRLGRDRSTSRRLGAFGPA